MIGCLPFCVTGLCDYVHTSVTLCVFVDISRNRMCLKVQDAFGLVFSSRFFYDVIQYACVSVCVSLSILMRPHVARFFCKSRLSHNLCMEQPIPGPPSWIRTPLAASGSTAAAPRGFSARKQLFITFEPFLDSLFNGSQRKC